MPALDVAVSIKDIARDAYKTGKTKSDDIKKLAAARGLIIEGTPEITGGGWLGGEPTLTGEFEIKRKPKRTTKEPGAPTPKPGGANNDPLGIRPKR